MQRLRPGWFLEGLWDAEYQQYRLLSYLQSVRKAFLAQQLYPPLADLTDSYHELLHLSDQVQNSEDPLLETLREIIAFALPRLQELIEEGKFIYETIAGSLQAYGVGVVPLYRDEGYVLVRRGTEPIIRAYIYEVKHLVDGEGKRIAIHLRQVQEYHVGSLQIAVGTLREGLMREHPELPVPYTLMVESPWLVPWEETLIPIIRRSLPRWAKEPPVGGIG
ncbi:MAG: hypothetical protein RMK98_07230 [Bacteroidia bacterium]|nr:hypothetical protein [Bacteroidia bacterium]